MKKKFEVIVGIFGIIGTIIGIWSFVEQKHNPKYIDLNNTIIINNIIEKNSQSDVNSTNKIKTVTNENICKNANITYRTLSVDKTYRFKPPINNFPFDIKIETLSINFTEMEDYNGNSIVPYFVQTNQIKKQKGVVKAKSNLDIIESNTTYQIKYYPSFEYNLFDIRIKYILNYFTTKKSNGEWINKAQKIECVYYNIE